MTASVVITLPEICELRHGEGRAYELQLWRPLSLLELRDSAIGKELMWPQDWYNLLSSSATPVLMGTYRIRLPIPGSNLKTGIEQLTLLSQGETIAPVALEAAALLCLQKAGYPDPLHGGWVRGSETTVVGARVGIMWHSGRLLVEVGLSDFPWLASAQRLDPAI